MHEPLNKQIEQALQLATYTKDIFIGRGAIGELPSFIHKRYPNQHAIIIADENTWIAAGKRIHKMLREVNLIDRAADRGSLILSPDQLHAEMSHVNEVQNFIDQHDNIVPIAVGGGTINDLTKLAASNLDLTYICVATAASVDGFGAYSASIEVQGHKQTIYCPAPLAVVADLDVICEAPHDLNAAGFGDLLAKYPAGVDWILADAVNIEPIDQTVWNLTRDELDIWTDDPEGIAKNKDTAIRNLFNGLIMQGIAMDVYQDTRPCSGAEHQFSHNLDMTNHRHHGDITLHGFKVAIASIAMSKLHDHLLNADLSTFDINKRLESWPTLDQAIAHGQSLFPSQILKDIVAKEFPKKYQSYDQLKKILTTLKSNWPDIRNRALKSHIPPETLKQKLAAAGCPTNPEQISVPFPQLKALYEQAYHTRARFTALDITVMLDQLNNWTTQIFNEPW
ncbi:sn-glycerol-1-phosphate dehydrogenase [Planctomycetota bacterium]|nr:sn-glycerol-1-phosphate dehydrogenase [Planctomycetota bacterium]